MGLSEMYGLLHEIHGVLPISDYRVILEFDEGEYRVVSIRPFIAKGGFFTSLNDKNVFKTVRVSESNTIEWENGVDLDPDVLYVQSLPLEIPQVI